MEKVKINVSETTASLLLFPGYDFDSSIPVEFMVTACYLHDFMCHNPNLTERDPTSPYTVTL